MAFCGKCGTQLNDGTKFCPKCGNPVGSTQTNETSSYSIELVSVGDSKLIVVKALSDLLGLGIKEATELANSVPCKITDGLTLSKAKEISNLLSTAGAKTIVKQNGKTIFIEEPSQNVDSQTEEHGGNKLMKYGAYVFGVLCFLYIVGTCEGGSSDSQEGTQIEQKQETSAEKQAREKKEKQDKIDRMMKEAFERGKDQAMNYTYYQKCNQWFNAYYFTPETDEEIELFKRYKAEYDKGWDEGKRIRAKMEN